MKTHQNNLESDYPLSKKNLMDLDQDYTSAQLIWLAPGSIMTEWFMNESGHCTLQNQKGFHLKTWKDQRGSHSKLRPAKAARSQSFTGIVETSVNSFLFSFD